MRTMHIATLRRSLAAAAAALALLALLVPLALGPAPQQGRTAGAAMPAAPAPAGPRHAAFGGAEPSRDARQLADWVADSGDNAGSGFLIVDKKAATLYVFDAHASLRGASRVLLGAALGDDSVPGIGTRPIAQVLPHERTTPAGRFVAERGRNALGHDVVWVDYEARVSIHRVVNHDARERRLQRLATDAVHDKRISYGCINVPVAFYESHVRPTFAQGRAMVYVLPERKPLHEVFGSYGVAAAHADVRQRTDAPKAGPDDARHRNPRAAPRGLTPLS